MYAYVNWFSQVFIRMKYCIKLECRRDFFTPLIIRMNYCINISLFLNNLVDCFFNLNSFHKLGWFSSFLYRHKEEKAMLNKYSVYNSKNTESNQFWALWFEHQPRLRSCCLRWLNGNHALVDDALSQAVEKTHNYYLKQHSEIRSPFSWFCKVTHNICIDIHREHKKQNNLYTQITEDPNQYYFSEYESEELEEQIERESQLECLYKALDGMKTEFKLAIKYRFIDEMEYSEIANILETTPENIRKRVQLARKELRLMAA